MATLKRTLGLPALTFYGIGVIVGAGIYSVIGAAAGEAGSSLWLSFVIGAVIAALTALSYAELTTMYPAAGAEYVYMREAFPKQPWTAFIVGILLLIAGAAMAATVALAFAEYLNLFVTLPRWLGASALLIACTAISISGIRQSSWANIIFTSIEVAGLILIIVVGVMQPEFGDALTAPPHTGVFAGAAVIFFVYLGFEEIANLAEETKNAKRNLPWAIFLSLGITTLLYTLVALSVVALAPAERLAQSDSAVAVAVGTVSSALSRVLSWIALFATANTTLISLIAVSRVLFAMARDAEMPGILANLSAGRRTPWMAALAVLGASLLFLPLGDIAVVASLSSLASLMAFAAVNLAVIVLRYRRRDRKRPFRVPLALGRFPILPAFGGLFAAGMMTQFDPVVYLIALVAIALGFVLYALRDRWRPPASPRR